MDEHVDATDEGQPGTKARSQSAARDMAHRVYWDAAEGVVFVVVEGLLAPGELTLVQERVLQCLPAQGPRLILTDFRRAHLSLNKGIRREIASMARLIPLDRDALVVGSHLHRMFGRLVLGAAGLGDKLRLFETQEQALTWLHHGEARAPQTAADQGEP